MKKEMTTKLYNIIAQNHLRTANSRGKNVHLRRHSERSEESLTFALCLFPFTFFTSVSPVISVAKFKFGKTNPI
jgi:hypothetical protein